MSVSGDDQDLSGVTSVSSQSPFSSCEDDAPPAERSMDDTSSTAAGIQALEVAYLLQLAEYSIGSGFKRQRASTISYSSSTYNDIKPITNQQQGSGSLQQYLDEIGDDELIAANFLSSMNQMKTDSWIDSDEPSPMYLIRTAEKIKPVSENGSSSYNSRSRPRSHSVSEISFFKSDPNLSEDEKPFLGSYSPEERRKRIERFLEKRKLRVWTKRVKYDVRKNFADSRVRVRGRFVKKSASDDMETS